MSAPICASMRDSRCPAAIAMIDNKGYCYCTPCGTTRRNTGTPCRALTRAERETLANDGTVAWRKPRAR